MKEIKATALKREDGQEVLRFNFTKPKDVVLTESNGTAELKAIFVELLAELMSDDVNVKFEPSPTYTNKMYEAVCKEYLKSLQGEINDARRKIVDEGIANAPSA